LAESSHHRLPHARNGFALLIALWLTAILALIDAAIIAGFQTSMKLAEDQRAIAYAESAADGGVAEAIFRLQSKQWTANATYALKIGAAQVNIQLQDEATKINPNGVNWDVLKSLMINVGVDAVTSTRIAKSIVDYRSRTATSLSGGQTIAQYVDAGLPYGPSNRPFESLDEIGLVIGMTPDLLVRIEPYLSIYQNAVTRQNDRDLVNFPLSSDIATPSQSRSAIPQRGSESKVVRIVSAVSLPGRVRFVREAIVRLNARPLRGDEQYQLLTWDAPND
jgi:general secretion pathway protein K